MINKLRKQNQWWENSSNIKTDVDLIELKLKKYIYIHPFLKKFKATDGVFIIKGPRQIGKSTLLKQLIYNLLIQKKTNPKHIFYYTCDTVLNFQELYEILQLYIENMPTGKNRRYIFIDEVTYINQWQRAIKQLVDEGSLIKTTIVITGSNLLNLSDSSELMPGRRGKHLLKDLDINFLPLGIKEFNQLVKGKPKNFLKLYEKYTLIGGIPNVINEYMTKGYISDVTYEIYLQWLIGDINKLGRNPQVFFRICKYLFDSICTPLSIYNIAKAIGSPSNESIAKYVNILEKLFVTKKISSYSVEQKQFQLAKNNKFYFIDPFIAWACYLRGSGITDNYFSNSQKLLKKSPTLQSQFIQSVIGIEMTTRYNQVGYYRNKDKKEIDFIGIQNSEIKEAIEVKLQASKNHENYQWFPDSFPELDFKILDKDSLSKWYK